MLVIAGQFDQARCGSTECKTLNTEAYLEHCQRTTRFFISNIRLKLAKNVVKAKQHH